jgi:hypothetical protein
MKDSLLLPAFVTLLTPFVFLAGSSDADASGIVVNVAPHKVVTVSVGNRTRSQRATEGLLAAFKTKSLQFGSSAQRPVKLDAQTDALTKLIVDADGSETGYTLTMNAGNAGATLDSGTLPSLDAFDFNADAVYPGSIVQGKPQFIQAGQLAPNPMPRNGGTVTLTDVQFQHGEISKHVSPGTASMVGQALQDLATQHFTGDQAGSTDCSYSRVYSSADASYKAQASFGYLGMASVKDTFSSADDHTQNHLLVTCRQEYFTASYLPDATNTSAGLASFFAPGVSLALANQFIGPKNPPLFVSSVTYGSELFMMADSKSSTSDMQNTIEAAANYAGVSGSASFTYQQQSVAKSMNITALAIGGRASAQSGVLTQIPGGDLGKGLTAYLRKSLNISSSGGQAQEVGLPISYKLSYLDLTPVQEIATVFGQTYASSPAALTSAKVHFHQEGDGKDWDTEVDILLKDANKATVAGIHLGKNTPFADNSTTGDYTLVPTQHPAISKDLMNQGSFDLIIHPVGHDTWNYSAYVTLYFDDGTSETGIVRNYVNENYTGRTAMLSGFVH